MYRPDLCYLGFKIESSPYTAPQADLEQADFDLLVENIAYSTEIQSTKLKYCNGDMSAFAAIMGKQEVTVSFRIWLTQGATAATAPKWFKVARACGCLQTAYTTTGIGLTLDSNYTAVPAYIEIHEVSDTTTPIPLVIQIRGCMGNMKIILDSTGIPVAADCEFKGVLQGIEDRAAITKPTGYDTVKPAAFMNTTITAFGEALDCDKFTIDFKNKVELYNDPSTGLNGYTGARIARSKEDPPTLQVDPYLMSIANRGLYARWAAGTTGAFACDVGTLLHISAPAIQIVSAYKGETRNSAKINTLDCILTRGASGDDELEILQGSKT
jgi:hypothetical protein